MKWVKSISKQGKTLHIFEKDGDLFKMVTSMDLKTVQFEESCSMEMKKEMLKASQFCNRNELMEQVMEGSL